MEREGSTDAFESDVAAHGGYVYTTVERLSSRLSNQRMSDAVLELADLHGKRVLDVGCGDGTYTSELLHAGARDVLGIDPAAKAIEAATSRFAEHADLRFEVQDVYGLADPDERYDVAILRGVLHHLPDAERAIARICELAHRVVVVEPNGYNPVLKVIEKISPYHRRHEEKSYAPRQLDRWFERHGGRVERSLYIGLVPFFCPDLMARVLNALEPIVERIPVLRAIACGQYVQEIRMVDVAKPGLPSGEVH